AAAPAQHVHTGIRGVALLGPIAPVERPGVRNERPLAGAVLDVRRATGGRILAEVRTDAHGHFTIPLRPGKYTVIPRPPHPGSYLPHAWPQNVTVTAHGYTSVTVHYDSGIR